VPDTQFQTENSHLPKQSQSQIPIFLSTPKDQSQSDGVQNGVFAEPNKQPESATSAVSDRCHGEPAEPHTPQKNIQKWGATDEQRNTSLPFGEGRGEAPPPRNRTERRAQERLLKKIMKAKQAA